MASEHHGQQEVDEQCPVCKAQGAKGPCPFDMQTEALVTESRAWEAKWLQEKMEHKKTADQVTYWKERADIEAGEVATLSKRVEELEGRVRFLESGEHAIKYEVQRAQRGLTNLLLANGWEVLT